MFDLKCDYEVRFKGTKRMFNLFNIRKTYTIRLDVEEFDSLDSCDSVDNSSNVDTDSSELEEMNYIINEYAKMKNLSDVKLISYTRYA